ncbi:MAG: putative toxin-antitoxin system toxin component, PIN family [Proteobacteria bacterium]|nr:putative toxin-antitoxin system toxin component, PIN family [Pseudomonadota bacterium]
MHVKVVIDTNIWISALVSPGGLAAELVEQWRKGSFTLIACEQQITELCDVLSRSKFSYKYHISNKQVEDIVAPIIEKAERVTIRGNITCCRDLDDNMLIEAAVRGKAKYLITGDKDIRDDKEVSSFLARNGVIVISVAKFLDLIRKA